MREEIKEAYALTLEMKEASDLFDKVMGSPDKEDYLDDLQFLFFVQGYFEGMKKAASEWAE